MSPTTCDPNQWSDLLPEACFLQERDSHFNALELGKTLPHAHRTLAFHYVLQYSRSTVAFTKLVKINIHSNRYTSRASFSLMSTPCPARTLTKTESFIAHAHAFADCGHSCGVCKGYAKHVVVLCTRPAHLLKQHHLSAFPRMWCLMRTGSVMVCVASTSAVRVYNFHSSKQTIVTLQAFGATLLRH